MPPSIDARTRLMALLGDPVEHSRSPLIHNTAFALQGINAVYLALPVSAARLAEAVAGLRALGFLGANVTIPHKQAVLPLLDTCSARARAVGAVNTIVCQTEEASVRLHGDNTDVEGFLTPLRSHAHRITGGDVVVLGAGGAARAVVYGLLTAMPPARLTLVARRPAQAEALATHFADLDTGHALRIQPWNEAGPAVRTARLVVNTTPVGMHPHTSATPWPDASDFGPEHLVYDLIYTPNPTQLMRDAARQGAATLSGLPMLVGQAAAAYAQWIGQPMPTEAVEAALRAALK